MPRSFALTLVAAMFAFGCVPPKASWMEVRSRHFVLKTDVPVSRADDLVRDLERSYAALRSCVSPGGADPPGMTQVVAFDDEAEYWKVAPPNFAAYFSYWSSPIESSRKIVFPANSELFLKWGQELLQHELTHRFVAHYMPNVPLWFNEGMSDFLSTARFDGDTVVMGDPPSNHWFSASGWMVDDQPLVHLAPDPVVLRTYTTGRLYRRDYLGAWMLVHVMVLGEARHRKALEGYLNDLRSGDFSEAEALEAHFDEKTRSEVDAAYLAFQKRKSTPTQAVALDALPTLDVVSRRAVPPAEALTIRGRLYGSAPEEQMLALQDANQAIATDPRSPEGYLLRATLLIEADNERSAVQDVRKALSLAPEDPRTRRGLGMLLLSLDGPTTEVKGLVEWVRERKRSAEDLRFLANWELRTNHPKRAIELAAQGISLDMWCIPCYELAARASFSMSDRDAAIRWQNQAVNVAAERTSTEMLERLARYEKAPAPKVPSEKDVIHAAIRARRPEFDACYEAALAKNAQLRGKVVIRFVVDRDGFVTDSADGGSELSDPAVIGCILERFRTLKFNPPAKGPRKLRHWFRFPNSAPGKLLPGEAPPAP